MAFKDRRIKEKLVKLSKNRLSISEMETIIPLLRSGTFEKVYSFLKQKKKQDLIENILSLSSEELEEDLEQPSQLEKMTDGGEEEASSTFTVEGYKKPESLEKKVEEHEPVTEDNFEKHPLHFKYAMYLLNQLEHHYHDSKIKQRLRKTFLGQNKEASTYHGVPMFRKLSTGEDEKYMADTAQNLRNDFSDKELMKITTALIGTLRDYYYGEFLGMENYEKYLLRKSDTPKERKKKIDKLRYLDSAIINQQIFGIVPDDIFQYLKQQQETHAPFGGRQQIMQGAEQLFQHMTDRHKEEIKQKILDTTISPTNRNAALYTLQDEMEKNPDFGDMQKKQLFQDLFYKGNTNAAKKVFETLSHGYGHDALKHEHKDNFERLQKLYGKYQPKDRTLSNTPQFIPDLKNRYFAPPDTKTA